MNTFHKTYRRFLRENTINRWTGKPLFGGVNLCFIHKWHVKLDSKVLILFNDEVETFKSNPQNDFEVMFFKTE